jgi:cob(I)alamin adenosyltransferase
MKIYTGTGDRGRTGLFSGERVLKCDDRIEAYGDVDELVSVIGAIGAAMPPEGDNLRDELEAIQSVLFEIGAFLATTPGSKAVNALPAIETSVVEVLEGAIDRIEAELPALHGFLLPGGHLAAGWAHVGRTVCRRAERRVVRLALRNDDLEIPATFEPILVYLNRLSDYLFVLARYLNRITGVSEKHWKPDEAPFGHAS